MNTHVQTDTANTVVNRTLNRKVDWVMAILLVVLLIANAYLAYYATINHDAFDAQNKQIAFIFATTLGLPFTCVIVSLLFSSMRTLSSQIKVLTLTSAIVFVSNVPLIVLIF